MDINLTPINLYLKFFLLIYTYLSMNKAYCINLLKREDRWLQVLNEYPKFVDEIERIEGIDKDSREGCYLSHIKALDLGFQLNLSSMLVLQDDIKFMDYSRKIWNEHINEVPSDWDIILGGVHYGKLKKRINKNIIQLGDFSGLHCGLYKLSDKINQLRNWEKGAFDRYIGSLAEDDKLNVYCILPFIAIQSDGFSNLRNRNTEDFHHFYNTEKNLMDANLYDSYEYKLELNK